MQKVKARERKGSASDRKSGRTSFDKSGRGIWEWQTATGVFERDITNQQLADLENSQLRLIDAVEPVEKVHAVSYYEWQEQSNKSTTTNRERTKTTEVGALKRLLNRFGSR